MYTYSFIPPNHDFALIKLVNFEVNTIKSTLEPLITNATPFVN